MRPELVISAGKMHLACNFAFHTMLTDEQKLIEKVQRTKGIKMIHRVNNGTLTARRSKIRIQCRVILIFE